jgi:hypothetical protein
MMTMMITTIIISPEMNVNVFDVHFMTCIPIIYAGLLVKGREPTSKG